MHYYAICTVLDEWLEKPSRVSSQREKSWKKPEFPKLTDQKSPKLENYNLLAIISIPISDPIYQIMKFCDEKQKPSTVI